MIILVILLFAMFASLFGLSKQTLEYADPFFLIGSRMFFSGILLLGFQLLKDKKSLLKLNKNMLLLLLSLGVVNIYLTNIAEIWGIARMVSARACLIYSLSPFLTAFFSYLYFKEVLSVRKWIGLTVGIVGLLPIFYDTMAGSNAFVGGIGVGEISVVIAVICSVNGWLLLRKFLNESHDHSPIVANGVSMVFGGILALAHSYLSGENWAPIPVTEMGPFLQNSLIMCLISNFICYNLYGYLLKHFSATFMSFSGLITPLFASLFGFFFLNEEVSWVFFLSLGIFATGLYLFHRDELLIGKKEAVQVESMG